MAENLPDYRFKQPKKYEPVFDRLVQIGWATSYAHNDKICVVHWTALGHKRMKYVFKCLEELCPEGVERWTTESFADFWAIVAMYELFESLAFGKGNRR
jgi:hypothetical protein